MARTSVWWLVPLVVLGLPISLAAQAPPAPPDVAAVPGDAQKTASGLASRVLVPGQGGERPSSDHLVVAHYTMWTTDGRVVDSTHSRKSGPARFPLDNVLAGWRECVTLMTEGEQRRCWIPANLAYDGQQGRPAGMIVSDIELVGFEPSPKVPPPDVASVPEGATKLPSGLAFRILEAGIGARRPLETSRVTVHYTGWTTDGKMFDSSVLRGEPTSFQLGQVIDGWTEGVQLMVVGERRRFWIPEDLAYKDGGGPSGMLVFDIELLTIDN